MSGYVLYRDHDGWFRWTTAQWWDDTTFKLDGGRVDTREEIGRFDTLAEAKDIRHAYNMMVHGKPTSDDGFNRMLERKGELT